jgi:hypothetical protein
MLAAACGVGVWLEDMTLAEVLNGFPVGPMVILAGVTYFFGIARANASSRMGRRRGLAMIVLGPLVLGSGMVWLG